MPKTVNVSPKKLNVPISSTNDGVDEAEKKTDDKIDLSLDFEGEFCDSPPVKVSRPNKTNEKLKKLLR